VAGDHVTLVEAVEYLYQTAVVDQARTSTRRLQTLARYCVEQLDERGLKNAEMEVRIPGGGRTKQWDVAWKSQAKYRLAISLKSILRNLPGTVPNRIDDLIGEVANIQMYSPEIVVGYLMVFDVSKDVISRRHGCTWCELLKARLTRLSGRRAPFWSVGMVEAFAVVEVDFSRGARLVTPEGQVARMLDILVSEVKSRNPSLSTEVSGDE
jgi:hypothetical protein